MPTKAKKKKKKVCMRKYPPTIDRSPELHETLLERLKEVHRIQTISYETKKMTAYITAIYNELKAIHPDEHWDFKVENHNIYITRGKANAYPCVVAHTDTVHKIYKGFQILEADNKLIAYDHYNEHQVGIGGDDKVGIFVALEMLRKFNTIKIAFFRDEEVGCQGSCEADMKWLSDTGFIVQCDRRGYADVVREIWRDPLFDDVFQFAINEIVDKYNRSYTDDGGITDVGQLYENAYPNCVMNLSCGYYLPHTEMEYIIPEEVFATMDFVAEVIEACGGHVWPNSYALKEPYRYQTYDHSDQYLNGLEESDIPYSKVQDHLDNVYGYEHLYPKGTRFFNVDYYNGPEDCMVNIPTSCPCCGSTELMYDDVEDSEFCMDCNDYTVVYCGLTDKNMTMLEYLQSGKDETLI